MKHTGICIASLMGGMVLGSALALLFAPKSGAELRHQIRESFNDEVDRLKGRIDEISERIEEARCRCNEQ